MNLLGKVPLLKVWYRRARLAASVATGTISAKDAAKEIVATELIRKQIEKGVKPVLHVILAVSVITSASACHKRVNVNTSPQPPNGYVGLDMPATRIAALDPLFVTFKGKLLGLKNDRCVSEWRLDPGDGSVVAPRTCSCDTRMMMFRHTYRDYGTYTVACDITIDSDMYSWTMPVYVRRVE